METTVTVGNVTIRPLLDAPVLMDPRTFMPDHAEQFYAEYADQVVDPRGLFGMSITCFLVRSGGRNILVDTGLGSRRRAGFPRGRLDRALAEAGVAPDEIDLVVNTHLHVDHTGWNTVDDEHGRPRIFFPRARWLIQKVEWEYWMQPRFIESERHPHLADSVAPLEAEGRVDFAYMEQAIDQNLHCIASPGHTPGHVCIGIYSAGEKAVIVGDASHHPAQLDHPDWSPAFDTDPLLSAKTRLHLFDQAADQGFLWMAGHWPHPGVGRIVRLERRRVFRAG